METLVTKKANILGELLKCKSSRDRESQASHAQCIIKVALHCAGVLLQQASEESSTEASEEACLQRGPFLQQGV